jgi:hypothetical protein
VKTRTINCMKTKHQILLVATTVAAFALNACVSSPHPGDAARAPINQALTASPRYREDHPELLRMPDTGEKSEARWTRSREYIAKLAENRALASSPRFLEDYQELLRTPETIDESEAKWARSREHLAKLAENRALATSPRFLEVHRELLFAPISEGRFQPW